MLEASSNVCLASPIYVVWIEVSKYPFYIMLGEADDD